MSCISSLLFQSQKTQKVLKKKKKRNTVYDSRDAEAVQVPADRQMAREDVVPVGDGT